MSAGEVALLAGAGFLAGAVNAVAGGGSLISFPALLAAGYGSVTANVTNAVSVLPGYVGGTWAYRRELAGQGGRARALGVTSAAGALAGALVLLTSPGAVFEALVPFLVLAACGLLALQPVVGRLVGGGDRRERPVALHASTFAASVYGGYFGAGLGIALLALLGLALPDDLQRLNALKGLLSLVIGAVAAACFAVAGDVAWGAAALVGAASLPGGAAGVRVARVLPEGVLRGVIVVYGVAVAVWLLLD